MLYSKTLDILEYLTSLVILIDPILGLHQIKFLTETTTYILYRLFVILILCYEYHCS